MRDKAEIGTAVVPKDVEEANGLLRLALEREDLSVDVLERLVALQERVTDRSARAEFFEALARFQDEVPEIRKSETASIATKGGGKYSYTFAPLEVVTRTIKKPLRDNGLSYSWTTEGMNGTSLNVVCILRHIGGHEERASFPVPTETNAAMSGAQKNGAALTYGKRQSLTSVLGLTTADEDTDGADDRGAYIDEKQVADLDALVEEVGADREKYLEFLGVAHLEALRIRDLPRAISALERKRKG